MDTTNPTTTPAAAAAILPTTEGTELTAPVAGEVKSYSLSIVSATIFRPEEEGWSPTIKLRHKEEVLGKYQDQDTKEYKIGMVKDFSVFLPDITKKLMENKNIYRYFKHQRATALAKATEGASTEAELQEALVKARKNADVHYHNELEMFLSGSTIVLEVTYDGEKFIKNVVNVTLDEEDLADIKAVVRRNLFGE